jgi:hypothetical protein
VDATTKRIDVLHQAASAFVQLVQRYPGDGVGMVSFDQAAYPGVPVTKYTGGPFDLLTVQNAISALAPQGATSIGAGVSLGRTTLNPVTGYDHKAMVVFTDGLENTAPYIADVAGSINDRTYAIGLGTAQQVSATALESLAHGTGGYLMLSGILSPSIDDTFRLTKYFLQILAGVTNNEIVTDPSGVLMPGAKVRIPFVLNETDLEASAILLTQYPVIRFLIETPDGTLLDPAAATALGATFESSPQVSFYRFTVPLAVGQGAHEGTWHAVLELDPKIMKRLSSVEASASALQSRLARGIGYCFTVQGRSNLRMTAQLIQSGHTPGSWLTLRASLSEYGIPVEHRSAITAYIERPDGTTGLRAMVEGDDGMFELVETGTIDGVYRFRLVAQGITLRGLPFTREQLLTGAILHRGDQPPRTSDPAGNGDLCELIGCLLEHGTLDAFLDEHKIDRDELRRCLKHVCGDSHELTPIQIVEREGTGIPAQEVGRVQDLRPDVSTALLEKVARLLEDRRPDLSTGSTA